MSLEDFLVLAQKISTGFAITQMEKSGTGGAMPNFLAEQTGGITLALTR